MCKADTIHTIHTIIYTITASHITTDTIPLSALRHMHARACPPVERPRESREMQYRVNSTNNGNLTYFATLSHIISTLSIFVIDLQAPMAPKNLCGGEGMYRKQKWVLRNARKYFLPNFTFPPPPSTSWLQHYSTFCFYLYSLLRASFYLSFLIPKNLSVGRC